MTLLNPLKFGGTAAVAVIVIIDVIGGIAEAFISIIVAFVSNDTALPPNMTLRWHLPHVAAPASTFP